MTLGSRPGRNLHISWPEDWAASWSGDCMASCHVLDYWDTSKASGHVLGSQQASGSAVAIQEVQGARKPVCQGTWRLATDGL
ncbi:hypothetical protein SRHO_G00057750 [Serrasalmus rhombeus]